MVRRERGKRRHTPASRQMHNQARSNHTVPRHAPPANPPPGGLLLSSWRPAECAQPVPPRSRDEPPASDGWSASTRIDLSDLMPKPRGRSDVWESHASLTPAGTRVASPAPPMRRSGDATLCWEGSYQRSKISGRRSVVRTVVGGTDRVPGRAQVRKGGGPGEGTGPGGHRSGRAQVPPLRLGGSWVGRNTGGCSRSPP